jgi:hypothetical protein
MFIAGLAVGSAGLLYGQTAVRTPCAHSIRQITLMAETP